jgi:hypothetical protein
MPPRLIVKKRPVPNGSFPESEELSDAEVSKPSATVKRLIKRVVKKELDTSSESSNPSEVEAIEEDPVNVYLSLLNSSDRLVMNIAKDHLGTSFCIEKSVGFMEFLSSRK